MQMAMGFLCLFVLVLVFKLGPTLENLNGSKLGGREWDILSKINISKWHSVRILCIENCFFGSTSA